MMVAVVVEAAAWGAVAVVAAPVPLALPMILKSSFEPQNSSPAIFSLEFGIWEVSGLGAGDAGLTFG